MSSSKPVDVTTYRTTPRLALSVIPSSTGVNLNGGVLWMLSSWWRLPRAATPNRWLSVSRPVGPRSIFQREHPPAVRDLPPPRAQENVGEKAHPRIARRRLRWARSTEADGDRECAETSPSLFLHRRLDKGCFIDGLIQSSHPSAKRRNTRACASFTSQPRLTAGQRSSRALG